MAGGFDKLQGNTKKLLCTLFIVLIIMWVDIFLIKILNMST